MNREQIQLAAQERDRVEQENEVKLAALKKEHQRAIDDIETKMQQQADSAKELSRRQMQSDSEFDKQKALLEQQIEFLNERNQSLENKEKELVAELRSQKQEASTWKADQKSKFETQIGELQAKIDEMTETAFEMESKCQQAEQLLSESQARALEQDTTSKRELGKLRDQNSTLSKQLEELRAKYDSEIKDFASQKDTEAQE